MKNFPHGPGYPAATIAQMVCKPRQLVPRAGIEPATFRLGGGHSKRPNALTGKRFIPQRCGKKPGVTASGILELRRAGKSFPTVDDVAQ